MLVLTGFVLVSRRVCALWWCFRGPVSHHNQALRTSITSQLGRLQRRSALCGFAADAQLRKTLSCTCSPAVQVQVQVRS